MAGWAAAAAGVGTAAGAAATGDVDPAFEMLTDGGGAGEEGDEGDEAGVGEILGELDGKECTEEDIDRFGK